jgi:DNA-binding MarR family transcriptional regulator
MAKRQPLESELKAPSSCGEEGAYRQEALSVAAIARLRYKQRRLRSRYFGDGLFRDPAWDILLDLFVAEHEGKKISVSSASGAAGLSTASGLRWLAKLEEQGLIIRVRAHSDARTIHVELTHEAREKMISLLTSFRSDP